MTDHQRKMIMYATSILNFLEREEIWDSGELLDKARDNALDLGLANWEGEDFVVNKEL